MKQRVKQILGIILIIALSNLNTFELIWAGDSAITIVEHSFLKATSYVIEVDGSTYKAFNGSTGAVHLSSSNFSYLFLELIDSFSDSQGEKSTIQIKEGIYVADTKLLVDKGGVIVKGSGQARGIVHGNTVIKRADDCEIGRIISLEAWGIELSDLFIDGNSANNDVDAIGLFIGSGDVKVRDVAVFYNRGLAIQVSSHACVLENVAAEYAYGKGFYITGTDDSLFYYCHAENNVGSYTYGYVLAGATTKNNYFIGCKSSLNDHSGWILENGVQMNTFISCQARENDKHGIWLHGAQQNTFMGSIIRDNSQASNDVYHGLYLDSYSSTHSTWNVFNGGQIDNTKTNKQKYNIYEADSNQDYNTYFGITARNGVTADIITQGSNSHVNLSWNGTTWVG